MELVIGGGNISHPFSLSSGLVHNVSNARCGEEHSQGSALINAGNIGPIDHENPRASYEQPNWNHHNLLTQKIINLNLIKKLNLNLIHVTNNPSFK